MKLNVTRIKLRWRELAYGPGYDSYTEELLRLQADPTVENNLRRNAYGGGNGAHDAVIDAIAEELVLTINEALSSLDPAKLEQLLDLLITTKMAKTH